VGETPTRRDRLHRSILFIIWLALVTWLTAGHIFWRDEVRAFSLALSGSSYAEMLRIVHGEGHPALWYLTLRAAHDIFPYREVLPITGAVIGVAAMAIFTFFAPFRTLVICFVLFSFYGAFEYVAMARNYGISALVMFALAALYPRIRNTLWLGLIIAILCNTNVPSCFLAAAFLLFRFVEMLTEQTRATRRDWLVFAGNGLLSAVGGYLCFRTVYPTFNDTAVSSNLAHFGPASILLGLIDAQWGFSHLAFTDAMPVPLPVDAFLLAIACVGLIRKPAGFLAAIAALVALKLFFYFVYVSYYRHEVLYLIFLICLYWMVARGSGGEWRVGASRKKLEIVGAGVFMVLLALQAGRLVNPIRVQVEGMPFSRIKDVAALLHRRELSGAIVMADPDTMLEPLRYYSDNPIWFLRQQRFGSVVHLAGNGRHLLSLTDVLADARQLHARTGRPVVFLSHLKLQDRREQTERMMFHDETVLRPREVDQFRASTRLIARLTPSVCDEDYDVYVYPR
jgi:hypothetical protein